MNFRAFAALAFLCSTGAAFAAPPSGLGLHLGLNFASVSTDSPAETDSTLGFVLGGTYDDEFAPDLYFVPGAQLIQRGFGFGGTGSMIDLKITYLEFPLLFQARFHGAGAGLTPFFTAGPVVGLKLGTSCSVDDGDCTVRDDRGVKSTEMGIEFGGGALFALENGGSVIAQVRYHLGLTRVADGVSDATHRGLLLQAGYLF
jgi:hypothetical protein